MGANRDAVNRLVKERVSKAYWLNENWKQEYADPNNKCVVVELDILSHKHPTDKETKESVYTTGKGLFENTIKNRVGPFVATAGPDNVKTLVFVCDRYYGAKIDKSMAHADRHASAMKAIDMRRREGLETRTDEEIITTTEVSSDNIPPADYFKAYSPLKFKLLLMFIGEIFTTYINNPFLNVYVTCPSRKGYTGVHPVEIWVDGTSVQYNSGQNICVTWNTTVEPPPTFDANEGEILACLWANWLTQFCLPGERILIDSIDTDLLILTGVAETFPDNVIIRFHDENQVKRMTDGTEKKYPVAKFLNVGTYRQLLPQDRAKRLSLFFAMILCGTDYCQGFQKVGPAKLMPDPLPLLFTKAYEYDDKAIEEYVTKAITTKKNTEIVDWEPIQVVIDQAKRHLEYCINSMKFRADR